MVMNNDESMDAIKIIDYYGHQDSKDEKNTEISKLYLYFLKTLRMSNYKRKKNENKKDDCRIYKPIIIDYNNKKINTFAYQDYCDLSDHLNRHSSRECNEKVYNLMNMKFKGNTSVVCHFLSNTYDSYFPDLKKDRHAFSFKNGIYVNKYFNKDTDCYEDRFFTYENDLDKIKKIFR